MSTYQLPDQASRPRRQRLYGLRPVAVALLPLDLFWGVAIGGLMYGTAVTGTLQLWVIPEAFVFSLLMAITVHAWRHPFDTPIPIAVPGRILWRILQAIIGTGAITGLAIVVQSFATS